LKKLITDFFCFLPYSDNAKAKEIEGC